MNPIKGMKFRGFFSKFRILNAQNSTIKRISLPPKQDITSNYDSNISEISHITTKYDKASQDIDNLIKSSSPEDQPYLQKVNYFLRKSKFKKARQLIIKLKRESGDTSTPKRAEKLLDYIDHLKYQITTEENASLNQNLQSIAKKYGKHLKSLPNPKHSSYQTHILQYVRAEANRARTAELPLLSYELIDCVLETGQGSPWLLLGIARSLDMVGKQAEALKILEELKKSNTGKKITISIDEAIENAQNNNKTYRQTKFNVYLAKHLSAIAALQGLDTKFMPSLDSINARSRIKSLIYKKALDTLPYSAEKSLALLNVILDYVHDDGAALQLKGEALVALKKSNQAILIWADLAHSQHEKTAKAAYRSISKLLTQKTKRISSYQPPNKAIHFYIEEHFKHHLAPCLTQQIKTILEQIEPPNEHLFDFELREHQLQLQFNTLVIEYLETKLREQGRLEGGLAGQKPGAISETALKAG